MDEQENQYTQPQPGQSITPGPQPVAPTQAPAPPAVPPQQPVPAPQTQQPVYQPPQQQPQPAYPPQQQPQYAPEQTQQPVYEAPRQGPNLKKIALVGGVFVVIAVLLTTAAVFLGGSGLALERFEPEGLDFSVSVPEGWETNTIDITTIDSIGASPTDAPEGDNTSVNITRTLGLAENAKQRFIDQAESTISNLGEESYQELFNIKISNLNSEQYGNDEFPAYLVTYDATDTQTNINYGTTTYLIYESTNSAINATFIYSDAYSSLGASAAAIVSSYTANSTDEN